MKRSDKTKYEIALLEKELKEFKEVLVAEQEMLKAKNEEGLRILPMLCIALMFFFFAHVLCIYVYIAAKKGKAAPDPKLIKDALTFADVGTLKVFLCVGEGKLKKKGWKKKKDRKSSKKMQRKRNGWIY